jgi:hypothetical protein
MDILIIILIVLIGFFLLCRELIAWYFKINDITMKLSRIIELLESKERPGITEKHIIKT